MKRSILLVSLIGFLLGSLAAAALYVKNGLHPKSIITTSFAIVTLNGDGTFITNTSNPGFQDIQLASDIAESVIYVAQSDRALSAAVERLNLLSVNAKDIKDNLKITQIGKSQIVRMALYWDSAAEGVRIVESITEVVPNILIETLNLGSVSVVDYPTDQGLTENGLKWYLPIAVSFVFALGAAAVGFFRMLLHPTLLDTSAVRRQLGTECLGAVPGDASHRMAAREALVSAAHVVRHLMEKDGRKCIYITSSQREEGKTSVCAQLGTALANQGKRVLLVDMDAGEPGLGKAFFPDIDHAHSVNAFLSGERQLCDVLLTVNPNLHLLARRMESGPMQNESRLLEALAEEKQLYDVILLDTAPVGVCADALLLNRVADGAILVIRYDTVWIDAIRRNIRLIEKTGTQVLGTVVTGVLSSGEKSYDYYGSQKNSAFSDLPVKEREHRKLKFRERKKGSHEHNSNPDSTAPGGDGCGNTGSSEPD